MITYKFKYGDRFVITKSANNYKVGDTGNVIENNSVVPIVKFDGKEGTDVIHQDNADFFYGFKYNIRDVVISKEGGYYLSTPESFNDSHKPVFSTSKDKIATGKKIEHRKYANGFNWYKVEGYGNWITEEGIKLLEISSTSDNLLSEDLLKEANSRYPIGTKFIPAHVDIGLPITVKGGWFKVSDTEIQCVREEEDGFSPVLYYHGKWARISEELPSNLIAEARRRYPVGTIVCNKNLDYFCTFEITGTMFSEKTKQKHVVVNQCSVKEDGSFTVYKDGKWADVLKSPEEVKPKLVVGRWYKTIGDQFKANKYIKFAGLNDRGQVTFTERVTQDNIYEIMANNTRPNPAGCTSINNPEKSLQAVPDSEIEPFIKKSSTMFKVNDIVVVQKAYRGWEDWWVVGHIYKVSEIGEGITKFERVSGKENAFTTNSLVEDLNMRHAYLVEKYAYDNGFETLIAYKASNEKIPPDKWIVGGYIKVTRNGDYLGVNYYEGEIWKVLEIPKSGLFNAERNGQRTTFDVSECEWIGMNKPSDFGGNYISVVDPYATTKQEDEVKGFNEQEFHSRSFNKNMGIKVETEKPVEIQLKF